LLLTFKSSSKLLSSEIFIKSLIYTYDSDENK
jgi:hypothetical protein